MRKYTKISTGQRTTDDNIANGSYCTAVAGMAMVWYMDNVIMVVPMV